MAHKHQFNYIIYHKGCLDGFSGFFVCYLSGRLTDDVEIYPDVPSATNVPPNIGGKELIIIDVAYKKKVLEHIFKYAKSVVFIDHHISIKEDVEDLYARYNKKDNISIIYDENRSGATLTWKYLFSRQKIPLFLKYVEDQDTGKWKYPKTKPFIFALRAYYHLSTENKSLNKWFRLLDRKNVAEIVNMGIFMKDYNDHLININIPRHTLHKFPSQLIFNLKPSIFDKLGQYTVAVFCGFNCPSVTELAQSALDRIDCDFVIMWIYNLEKKEYVLSMRSKKVDVSLIATIFGGGGHKLAAAGSFSATSYKIDDLFYGNPLPRSFK